MVAVGFAAADLTFDNVQSTLLFLPVAEHTKTYTFRALQAFREDSDNATEIRRLQTAENTVSNAASARELAAAYANLCSPSQLETYISEGMSKVKPTFEGDPARIQITAAMQRLGLALTRIEDAAVAAAFVTQGYSVTGRQTQFKTWFNMSDSNDARYTKIINASGKPTFDADAAAAEFRRAMELSPDFRDLVRRAIASNDYKDLNSSPTSGGRSDTQVTNATDIMKINEAIDSSRNKLSENSKNGRALAGSRSYSSKQIDDIANITLFDAIDKAVFVAFLLEDYAKMEKRREFKAYFNLSEDIDAGTARALGDMKYNSARAEISPDKLGDPIFIDLVRTATRMPYESLRPVRRDSPVRPRINKYPTAVFAGP